MKLVKHCNYRGSCFNVLPAIVITRTSSHITIALKWGTRHLGWKLSKVPHSIDSDVSYLLQDQAY